MFEEKEPGKPQNWALTVTVIVIISLINVCIFVVIRVMLDSENEFDEPIIQGELRDDLTKFLGIFSLTFCFGCWCCFCCAGNFHKIFYLCNPKRMKFGQWWANIVGQEIQNRDGSEDEKFRKFREKKIQIRNTLRRKNGVGEINDIELGEAEPQGNSNFFDHKVAKNKSLKAKISQFEGDDYDRKVSALPSLIGGARPSVSAARMSSSTESSSSIVLEMVGTRKISQEEKRRQQDIVALSRRRWSMTPDGSAIAMDFATTTAPTPTRPNALLLAGGSPKRSELSIPMAKSPLQNPRGQNKNRAGVGSIVAVRNVDFLQVPVQNMTPLTVAIVDKGRMNVGFDLHDDNDDESAALSPSPIVSPNTPVSKSTKTFTEIDIHK